MGTACSTSAPSVKLKPGETPSKHAGPVHAQNGLNSSTAAHETTTVQTIGEGDTLTAVDGIGSDDTAVLSKKARKAAKKAKKEQEKARRKGGEGEDDDDAEEKTNDTPAKQKPPPKTMTWNKPVTSAAAFNLDDVDDADLEQIDMDEHTFINPKDKGENPNKQKAAAGGGEEYKSTLSSGKSSKKEKKGAAKDSLQAPPNKVINNSLFSRNMFDRNFQQESQNAELFVALARDKLKDDKVRKTFIAPSSRPMEDDKIAGEEDDLDF